jgi:CRISPR-associated protein Cmx8
MSEEMITLRYDPFSLPTAQHRAGLAGLLVVIESLRRHGVKPLPNITPSPDGFYELSFSRENFQTVFNELYDAVHEERSQSQKRKDKAKKVIPLKREEKRRDEKTGKEKTFYIYDQIVPKAGFLSLDMPEPWLKLWRDSVWSTLRGIPLTRLPYENRGEKKDVQEAGKLWTELGKFIKNRDEGKLLTKDVPSCLFLGAQAVNAEMVPFLGRVDENILLHFWPVVMGVYVPEAVDSEGKTEFKGYVLAIPDVADMGGFVKVFPKAVAQLGTEMHGYRPRDAVISVPQEGALEYLHHLLALAKSRTESQELAFYYLSGVEVYHLEKRGNSVHMLSSDHIGFDSSILEDYGNIRRRYASPLFRRQLVLNLLQRKPKPWFSGFDRVFSSHPREFFLGRNHEGKDRGAVRFSADVHRRFQSDFNERRS